MSPKSKKRWDYEVIKMRKKAILRGLLWFPLAIAIGYVITIFVSLGLGHGRYVPCPPSLTERIGSELGATVLQAAVTGLIGALFAAASVIMEVERWSIAKETGLYFLVTALTILPAAYFMEWMAHTLLGFLTYFGLFVAIFLMMWVIQYVIWKQKLKRVNAKLKDNV